MQLLDGKLTAGSIELKLHEEVKKLKRSPGLAFILIGSDPASSSYIRAKKKACERLGIVSKDVFLPEGVSEPEVLGRIEALNNDPEVDGVLLQLPLPPHLRTDTILEAISPEKDVDGFHPLNAGRLLRGENLGFVPCTPLGIQKLLIHAGVAIEGRHVVILGRSNIVGKPLGALLLQKKEHANATVTFAHRETRHLSHITKEADIVVAAIGSPHFVRSSMVKEGAVVVDVGINRLGNQIVGDVAFDEVAQKASFLSPVPGGVGPMTIAMLMANTVQSALRRT